MSIPPAMTEARLTASRTAGEALPARPAAGGRLFSPRLVVCLLILTSAAIAMPVLERQMGINLRKEAVPLKRPLASLDARKLEPDYRLHSYQHDRLSTDTVASLGTEEYLQLILVDTRKPAEDPTRIAHVFLTYYTGKPDMVPHIPDECYQAGGFDPRGASNLTVTAPHIGAPDDKLSVRSVRFEKVYGGGRRQEIAILYFFHVNNDFAATRTGLRLRLSNLFERYAYYSKIEINFTDDFPFQRTATQDESVAALPGLLERLMPVLYEDHFDLSKFASVPR